MQVRRQENEDVTTRDNSKKSILLTAVMRQFQNWGGPAVTMQFLMKAREQSAWLDFDLESIYSDTIQTFYGKIEPSTKGFFGSKIFPAVVSASLNRMFSLTGFTLNLLRAVVRNHGRKIIFHCHDFASAYLCSRLFPRIPVVLTLHYKGGWLREALSQYPNVKGTSIEKILRHVESTSIQNSKMIIFTSNGALSLFESVHSGELKGKDARVIHAGVDTKDLSRVKRNDLLREKYHVKRYLIVFVGGLVKDKGIDVLIRSIGALPHELREQITCLIVGAGILKESLESLIRDNGLTESVSLAGFLERQEVLELMKLSDVFTIPSIVSVFDQALLEASALGASIITTGIGGNIELFDSDSAVFVPPNDERALSNAIQRLLSDPALRERLAENAKARVAREFSIDSMLESYSRIYNEVVNT